MDATADSWTCPNCQTEIETDALSFYAQVNCSHCGLEDRVNTLIANYRIEGILGVGGMSIVYRARDLLLDRPVALKLLNDTYKGQPERIKRFEKECASMALVRHPNVVSVYSAGMVKDQFYIAMELAEGRNLELLVGKTDEITPLIMLDIVRQVALGLDAAHQAGLLHRDMKPGNILLSDEGHAKVLDFGLSLQTSEADMEELIWATPFYVAPETLMREPEDLRTDIYSLGITLRHLLTGIDELANKELSGDDMLDCKLRLPSIKKQNPKLRDSLCQMVDFMTQYDPSDRPCDYDELLIELEDVMADIKRTRRSSGTHDRKYLKLYGIPIIAVIATAISSSFLTFALVKVKQGLELPAQSMHDFDDNIYLTGIVESMGDKSWEDVLMNLEGYESMTSDQLRAVWSAQLRWVICYMQQPEDEVKLQVIALQIESRLSNSSQKNELRHRLEHLSDLRCLKTQDSLIYQDERYPLLNFATDLTIIKNCLEMETDSSILPLIVLAKSKLAGDNASLAKLTILFETYAAKLLANAATKPAANNISVDFDQSRRTMSFEYNHHIINDCISSMKLSPARKLEMEVCKEVCQEGEAFLERLRHAADSEYRDGLAPEALLSMTERELGSAERRCALACLELMLRGEYDDARRFYPYIAEGPGCIELAVKLNDWLQRLGK